MDKGAEKIKDIYNTIVHNYQDLDAQSKDDGKWLLRKYADRNPFALRMAKTP